MASCLTHFSKILDFFPPCSILLSRKHLCLVLYFYSCIVMPCVFMNISIALKICSKSCTEHICSCRLLGPRTRISQRCTLRREISESQGTYIIIFANYSNGCISLYPLHVKREGLMSRAGIWIWLVGLHTYC